MDNNAPSSPGTHIDSLRVRLPQGPHSAGLQDGRGLAHALGAALGQAIPTGTQAQLGSMRLRITEAELAANPAQAIARAIARQLATNTQGSRP